MLSHALGLLHSKYSIFYLFIFVEILQALRKQWQSEKDNLVRNFDRIVQNKNGKKKGKKMQVAIFYDPAKFQTLTRLSSNIQPSASGSNLMDIDPVSVPCVPANETHSSHETIKVSSKKKSHSEYCFIVCICCLEKSKEKRPRKVFESESLSKSVSDIYPDLFQDKVYLPEIICQCCYDKLKSNKFTTSPIDYKSLVESAKISLCFDSSPDNKNSVCEVCKLGSTTINPKKVNLS